MEVMTRMREGFGFGMGYKVWFLSLELTLLFWDVWGVGMGRGSSSFTRIKLKFPLFMSKKKKPVNMMRNTGWKSHLFTH